MNKLREGECNFSLLVEGERPFIDKKHRIVREDHGVIIGQPSMEGVTKDFEVKGGGC